MDDPVSTLLGIALITFGSMFILGGIKNRKILGHDGMLATALRTGSLTKLDTIPLMFPPFGVTPTIGGQVTGTNDTPQGGTVGGQIPRDQGSNDRQR